jgi:hypothetical protein
MSARWAFDWVILLLCYLKTKIAMGFNRFAMDLKICHNAHWVLTKLLLTEHFTNIAIIGA